MPQMWETTRERKHGLCFLPAGLREGTTKARKAFENANRMPK